MSREEKKEEEENSGVGHQQEEDEEDSSYGEESSDDDDGREYSGDSEDNQDEKSYLRHRKAKARVVVTDFLRHVEENRFAVFNWPPDPKSPTYKLGMTMPYVREFWFEKEANTDQDYCTAKKFLNQVRTSWGYDVDCNPPNWLRPTLFPLSEIENDDHFGEMVKELADFAVERINQQSVPEIGKTFELVRIEKAVKNASFVFLFTLTIKETKSNAEKIIRVAVSIQAGFGCEILECKLIPSLS